MRLPEPHSFDDSDEEDNARGPAPPQPPPVPRSRSRSIQRNGRSYGGYDEDPLLQITSSYV